MIKYLLLLTVLVTGCGKPKQQLNLFIWPGGIDPKLVTVFERDFDCRIVLDRYDTPEAMMAKMAGGGASIYDIVVPSNTTLPIMVKQGLLATLRHENLPNLKNIDPQFVNPSFDPGNQHGSPHLWGTSGLYGRPSNEKPLEETWGLLFDPGKQPGNFLLLDDARTCIGAALRFKGHSSNTTNLAELVEARDVLIEAKRRSLGFENSTGGRNRVLSRGAIVAMTYTEALGMGEDPETRFFVPREGSEIWLDLLSVPAHAPHRDLAEKFINFMLEGRNAAQNASYLKNASANRAALDFLGESDSNNLALYPPPEVRGRLEFTRDLGENNKLYDEIWTQIKSK